MLRDMLLRNSTCIPNIYKIRFLPLLINGKGQHSTKNYQNKWMWKYDCVVPTSNPQDNISIVNVLVGITK